MLAMVKLLLLAVLTAGANGITIGRRNWLCSAGLMTVVKSPVLAIGEVDRWQVCEVSMKTNTISIISALTGRSNAWKNLC